MELLIAHLVGDYLLQSDWMATEKTKKTWPAVAHVATYTLPFLLITQSPVALVFIAATHFLMDRFRLVRYLCWAKNYMGSPPVCDDCGCEDHVRHLDWDYLSWKNCSGTGYHKDRPPWMSVWLMIIADNTVHLACNWFAVMFLASLTL